MQKIDCSKRFRIWKLEILFFWKELKKKKNGENIARKQFLILSYVEHGSH